MNRTVISLGSYSLSLFQPDVPAEGLVVLPLNSEQAPGIISLFPDCPAALLFIDGMDWNRDLSPWPAPAVFPGEDDFSGQADAFLRQITQLLLPAAEQTLPQPPQYRALAGYSLSGLFSVYAAFRTDVFTRIGSASGSLWYDGFSRFAEKTSLATGMERAYFSIGAKEKRTRNLRMASVEDNTRKMEALFRSRGVKTSFAVNPGNHFCDTDARLAAALRFLTAD